MQTLQTVTGLQQTLKCNCAKGAEQNEIVTRNYVIRHKESNESVYGKLISHAINCRSGHIFQMLHLTPTDWTVITWAYKFH